MRGLCLVVASGGHSSSRCAGLSLSRPLLLWSTGSRRAGSVVVAHGPSCSVACGILPDQGSNPCPLHWQADSQPLCHQGSPYFVTFVRGNYYNIFNLRPLEILVQPRSSLSPGEKSENMWKGVVMAGLTWSRELVALDPWVLDTEGRELCLRAELLVQSDCTPSKHDLPSVSMSDLSLPTLPSRRWRVQVRNYKGEQR